LALLCSWCGCQARYSSAVSAFVLAVTTVVLLGCRDDGSEPPSREDCGTGCDDGAFLPGDGGGPPLECGDLCLASETCINNVCQPIAPALPACSVPVVLEQLDVEIPMPSVDHVIGDVIAAELGLGEGEDLMIKGVETIFVVPGDPSLPPTELLDLPEFWSGPEVGDVSGDGVPDLVVISGSRAEVYVGDGQGGFAFDQSRTFAGSSGFPLLVGDIDGDEDADFVFRVDDSLRWLPNDTGTLGEMRYLPRPALAADLRTDAAGNPELWSGYETLTVYRPPALLPEELEHPLGPGSTLWPLLGRYTGRTEADALAFTSRASDIFVVVAEYPEVLHVARVADVSAGAKSGDLDGDGWDDLLLGRDVAVLGLARGTPDDPFAGACVAKVEGLEGVWSTFARWLPGEPEQVIGWSGGLDDVPRVYVPQLSP